ncbi:MAG: Eco57I restriction-modification methylase domain-containing protein [Terriglobia bacterium]
MPYVAIHAEGGLIPSDILDQIAQERLPGQKATDFGLEKGRRLSEEISRAWSDAQDYWHIFSRRSADLPEGETGTTLTRERWVVRLFNDLLGYGLTFQATGAVVEGRTYPISHRAGSGEESPPVHIEGFRVDLDRRPSAGHRRLSPQALVQDYLNRSEQQLWGVVTNGYRLRLLRETPRTSRPAYLEFDLQSILDGSRFNEFALFYRLCHRTRLSRAGEDASKCLLESYYQESIEQGGRVRDRLRDGVVEALTILGNGFLRHPENAALAEWLQAGNLNAADYHRQLLRLIYRLLFLMVAEERHMIVPEGAEADRRQGLYDRYYSLARLRERAEAVVERSPFSDLWIGLCRTFQLFNDVPGENPLGIPPLNGDLFSSRAMPDLEGTRLSNHELLLAMRRLCLFREKGVQQRVNYSALDVEELGSVYESLLDFQPAVERQPEGLAFELGTGTERKSTGSYYTRPELVAELIESALVPVLEERVNAVRTKEEKERAILSIKVCDSASGSGHFLLAAARRMGRELAKVRTGEEEPTPEKFHLAIRDVISHCIYGVDMNPLAVDLCKLSLWLEGHWTGKPLSFLDHHIKCGNSLIGVFDPEVLKQGIPDGAFNPVTGDDRKAAAAIKKRNKKERESPTRRLPFERTALGRLEDLAQQLGQLSEVVEDNPADVKRKAELYRRIHESPDSYRTHRAANLWTAAFLVPLTRPDDPAVPTTESLSQFIESGTAYGPMIGQADSLALKHRFFHWSLEFPEVFVKGGFDVVLGNPPWERINVREEEFFALRAPDIANCSKKSNRGALIRRLETDDPLLWKAYRETLHNADAFDKTLRFSGRFPLAGRGDINTYAVFAELGRRLIGLAGRAGLVLPIGVATDDTTKAFFSDVVDKRHLVKLIGFENEAFIFPAVHHSFKFCALTLTGGSAQSDEANFAFFCRHFEDVQERHRRFKLSDRDFALLNPNTRTCPIFRTNVDAELTKKIYRRIPILLDERSGSNPWRLSLRQMFHMADDSSLFFAPETLPTGTPWALLKNDPQENGSLQTMEVTTRGIESWVPLYEAKMIHQFDHRYGTYEGSTQAQRNVGTLPQPGPEQKIDPAFRVIPRYWVSLRALRDRIDRWNREETEPIYTWEDTWLLGFRDITSAVVDRTAIFSLLPRTAVGHTAPLALLKGTSKGLVTCFLANLNSLPLDYVARQKVGGTHLTYSVLNQLPVLPPTAYGPESICFILPRVLELVYTAWDIKGFASNVWRDSDGSLRELIRRQWGGNKTSTGGHEWNPPEWAEIGQDGIPLPPFKWGEERRARLRAELDAYYAHLYGLTRDELRYVLDPKDVYGPDFPGETFRVLKDKEEKLYGEYRTRRLVLEAFDRMSGTERFINTGDSHSEMTGTEGTLSSKGI